MLSLSQYVESSDVKFGTSGARGLVVQMTDQVCYAYTQAFLKAVVKGATRLVIGHDLRPSSPAMAAACAQAVMDAGMAVVFVGAMPTPAVAYFASTLRAPSIIITGSHIPFDRNGIKFYRADGEISKTDEQSMLAAAITVPVVLEPKPLPTPDATAVASYVRRYAGFFGPDALRGVRVAVYEHSSVARDLLRTILESLGAQVQSLGRADTFVPIDTEAVRPEDIAQARHWAEAYDFDAILSTDGDADRPLIGDERGNWLRGDIVGILCAQYLRADAVVTPVSSNTAVEKSGLFKKVIRTRIGSPYVIDGMEVAAEELRCSSDAPPSVDATSIRYPAGREESGCVVVGYEANGGFLLGSEVSHKNQRMAALPTRDAVLPMLTVLCMARERGLKLSELAMHLPQRYTSSDRLQNFANEISHKLLAKLQGDMAYAAKLLAPGAGNVVQTNTTDGLRVEFANGDIVHLRPSGNAPELRCYAEADSEERARELCDSCLARVHSTLSGDG